MLAGTALARTQARRRAEAVQLTSKPAPCTPRHSLRARLCLLVHWQASTLASSRAPTTSSSSRARKRLSVVSPPQSSRPQCADPATCQALWPAANTPTCSLISPASRSLRTSTSSPTSPKERRLAFLVDTSAASANPGTPSRSRSKPHAFLPYMNHHGPRLIVNDADALSSNLLHGVTLRPLAPPVRALAAAMCSSLTLLSAEIEGRAYGGGVLKLETKEAERLLAPRLDYDLGERLAGAFDRINTLRTAGDLEAAASIVDDMAGLDHGHLWGAYIVFRTRRLNRRRAEGAAKD